MCCIKSPILKLVAAGVFMTLVAFYCKHQDEQKTLQKSNATEEVNYIHQ